MAGEHGSAKALRENDAKNAKVMGKKGVAAKKKAPKKAAKKVAKKAGKKYPKMDKKA